MLSDSHILFYLILKKAPPPPSSLGNLCAWNLPMAVELDSERTEIEIQVWL